MPPLKLFTCFCVLTTIVSYAANNDPSKSNLNPDQHLDKYRSCNLSHGFTENKGQIVDQDYKPNPAVKYLLCSPGFNVQLRQSGFSYDTYTDTPDETEDAIS